MPPILVYEQNKAYIIEQFHNGHIECKGFNDKNDYSRQTPCDPDFLRKIAKDTPSESLMRWFNEAVQPIFRRHRFFDKAGIFIGDDSSLFVPDNEHYEGRVKMFFDEYNHPASKEHQKTLSASELKKCQCRTCLTGCAPETPPPSPQCLNRSSS